MRLPILCLISATLLFAQDSPVPADAQGWLNLGVREYKNSRYAEAIAAFRKALDLNPNDLNTRLYLAGSYLSQYIPGAKTPENEASFPNADSEFRRVLEQDPDNRMALGSLASLYYQHGRLDEAAGWYRKLTDVDPAIKEIWYSLGAIAWWKSYPDRMQARKQIGMRPDDPGPIPIVSIRLELKNKNGAVIDDGIADLEKALRIDPAYDNAMAYLNLLFRERADLQDTQEQYRQDISKADEWVQYALSAKRMPAQPGLRGTFSSLAPPPPPPPPSFGQAGPPQRIRVGGNVEAANLLNRIEPVYPPLALEARIQGTVRFTATIDKQGRIAELQLVSGHPLLVTAARDAVVQNVYKPTLLNGNPVEVITSVDVNFTLP